MNKKFAVLALVAACGFGASAVQAKDLTGWFVNAGTGSAHYHATLSNYDVGSDSDTAFDVNVGLRSQFTGIEAGYIDLGSISNSDKLGNSYNLSGDGWKLGLNGHFNPTRMWYISAHGGLFMWKLHAKGTLADGLGGVDHYSGHQQSMDWYAGVGTGVDFNRHWSLGVKFDYYKIKKDDYDIGNRVYTLNAEYRF